MRLNIFAKTLRDQYWALFFWLIGLFLIALYLNYLFPFVSKASGLMQLIDRLPPLIKNLISREANTFTPAGFFNLQPFSIFAPLIFLLYAIAKGSDALAGEEERGTLDLLLAQPVSRRRVLGEKFLAAVFAMGLMAAVFWIGMVCGAWLFGIPLSRLRLFLATGNCFLLAVAFYCLALFVGAASGRRKFSTGLVGGFAVVSYLVNAYAPMVKTLQSYRLASPFYYYIGHAPLINGLLLSDALVLLGLSLVFLSAALFAFQRRDLRV